MQLVIIIIIFIFDIVINLLLWSAISLTYVVSGLLGVGAWSLQTTSDSCTSASIATADLHR
jgi:hypothetical protein